MMNAVVNSIVSVHDEGCKLRTVSAYKMYDFVSEIIVAGKAKNILRRIEGDNNE